MLFAIICTDKPGALDMRMATRHAHLDYLKGFAAQQGTTGPLLDPEGKPCGSLLVVDVADRAAAEALAAGDPYATLVAMKTGDRAFFYPSNLGKEIVGGVEVVREAYPDPTVGPDDPKGEWVCVDVKAVGPMPRPVTLAEIKADPALADLALVRMSRLSVMPVGAEHWKKLAKMGGWKG